MRTEAAHFGERLGAIRGRRKRYEKCLTACNLLRRLHDAEGGKRQGALITRTDGNFTSTFTFAEQTVVPEKRPDFERLEFESPQLRSGRPEMHPPALVPRRFSSGTETVMATFEVSFVVFEMRSKNWKTLGQPMNSCGLKTRRCGIHKSWNIELKPVWIHFHDPGSIRKLFKEPFIWSISPKTTSKIFSV